MAGANKSAARRKDTRRAGLAARLAWTGLAVVAVGVLGFFILRSQSDSHGASGRAAPGGPDVAMTDFDGERFSLSDYRGTPVVMNFWASWCPNCIAEMPDFERVHRDVQGEAAFLGVNTRDKKSAARELAHETGVTYRLAEDPVGQVFDAFGGAGMPTTVFIDADGHVAEVVTGQLSEGQLRDLISQHFGVEA